MDRRDLLKAVPALAFGVSLQAKEIAPKVPDCPREQSVQIGNWFVSWYEPDKRQEAHWSAQPTVVKHLSEDVPIKNKEVLCLDDRNISVRVYVARAWMIPQASWVYGAEDYWIPGTSSKVGTLDEGRTAGWYVIMDLISKLEKSA